MRSGWETTAMCVLDPARIAWYGRAPHEREASAPRKPVSWPACPRVVVRRRRSTSHRLSVERRSRARMARERDDRRACAAPRRGPHEDLLPGDQRLEELLRSG